MYLPPFKTILQSLGLTTDDLMDRETVEIPVRLFNILVSSIVLGAELDEENYLKTNTDIKVQEGEIRRVVAQQHYAAHGYFEGRESFAEKFDEEYYLSNNPDLKDGIESKQFKSPKEHYQLHGRFELRAPNAELARETVLWKKILRL